MDQLSQALNRGAQAMPAANSRLQRRALGATPHPRKHGLYPYGVARLAGSRGQPTAVQRHVRGKNRLYAGGCAAALANQNHTSSRLRFLRFGQKIASTVRKIYFIVRNGQSRTINKPKTNTLWEGLTADCMITSLAYKNFVPTVSAHAPPVHLVLRNNLKRLPWVLYLGPQRTPSACSHRHRPTLKSPPRKTRLYLYGVYTLSEYRGRTRVLQE